MTTTGQLLREMFTRMVIAKNVNLIDTYYHPDFLLHTNGTIQNLEQFRAGHARVYPTQISYSVEYDGTSWIETSDQVGARVWITTSRPDLPATRIEVILLAHYRDGLLWRLQELTWPDWRSLDELADYD